MLKTPDVILVVDDDAAVRNALKFALEVEGFSVRLYATPEALLAEKDLPAAGCLVIDYRMPECQSAFKRDPGSASKRDPPEGRVLTSAHPPSELFGRLTIRAAAGSVGM